MDPRAPSSGNLECFDGLDSWMGVSPYSSSNCHSPNLRKLKSPCSSLSNFFEKLAHASSAAFRAGSRGQTFSARGCCLECLLEALVHRLTRSVHLRELGVLLHHSCLGSTCPLDFRDELVRSSSEVRDTRWRQSMLAAVLSNLPLDPAARPYAAGPAVLLALEVARSGALLVRSDELEVSEQSRGPQPRTLAAARGGCP